MLRIQPVLGRRFSREDDSPGSPETAILTYAYWQRKFGGDRGVLGRQLIVDGRPREVIGALAQDFKFLDRRPAVLLPLRFNRAEVFIGTFGYQAVARLKPGTTVEQANADVARMIPLVVGKFPLPPGFTLGISLLTGVLFRLIPAFTFATPRVAALKDGGRTASDSRTRHQARSALVVSEIALALVLLIASGLMMRTFQAMRHVDPGFTRPEEVLTLRISIPEGLIADPAQAVRTHEQILRRVAQLPGVISVGLASSITMDGFDSNDPIFVEERPSRWSCSGSRRPSRCCRASSGSTGWSPTSRPSAHGRLESAWHSALSAER